MQAKRNVVKRSVVDGKRLTLLLAPKLYEKARRHAERRQLSVSDWIRQAILAYERKAERYESKDVDATWPSGWPKNQPCPGGGCTLNHDPAWHLANEARLVRSDNVRQAFAAAGLDSDPFAD